MSSHVAAVIPARMGSSRFPGKPLVKIAGLPMIEHVRRRVLLSGAVDDVFVATCDREIFEAVQGFKGKAVMTSDRHERCTERVREASDKIEGDIFVIVQGDEPLFDPDAIKRLVEPLKKENVLCSNLVSVITDRGDLNDIDIVKTVLDEKGDVLYYSRSPIPYYRQNNDAPCYRQTGISAFKKEFLQKFTELKPTRLEIAESVDFLRIIGYGFRIRAVVTEQKTYGVDRHEDVELIERILKTDDRQKKYYEEISKL